MKNKITGKIQSEKGFYIGDICYVLDDATYHGVWGGAGYEGGIYEVPGTGYSFAAAHTAYGDGIYTDDGGHEYDVDAGNIGLVPLELVEDGTTAGGQVFDVPGEAYFEACDGVFEIELPDGDTVIIDTRDEEDGEDGYY